MKKQKLNVKKLSREEMKSVMGGTEGGGSPSCDSNDSCTYKCSVNGVCSSCCVAGGFV